ncbi:hypothetical protein Cgig2_005952 [Carnegiea gigantea]|uniref:Aminotransferase-like plant mobile domain-containing protein n=1 Tax=Carnegiea gigantea TaxID=171969 RepID=A0A9Q1KK47_9CARY|nr:hypothetical protein Cgig2_005952 [Carnegiea gigantea]
MDVDGGEVGKGSTMAVVSSNDSVSLVEESDDDVGVSGSDGDDSDDVAHVDADSGDGSGTRGERGVVLVSVRGRCTLEKICKFDKTLEPHQREVIEGMILKPILDYRPFSMQWDLTTALVKAWVPRRKPFRLAGRLVCQRVEFGEDDLSATELVRMVRLRMAQYVAEKSGKLKMEKGSKKPVFRNYLKVVNKLLDANKEPEKLGLWLSLYAWMVMSGVMFLRTPYGVAWSVHTYIEDIRGWGEYAWAEAVWRLLVEALRRCSGNTVSYVSLLSSQMWFYEHTARFAKHDKGRFPRLASWDSVDHGRRYDAFELVEGIKESEVIPVLRPREEEMMVRIVRHFMGADGFQYFLLDGEGVLSYEERLEQTREELCTKKEKHIDIERKLQFWMTHAKELEARLNMGKAHGYHPDAGPQCAEPNVVPFAAVEDVWQTPFDATVVSCREGKVDAHEHRDEWQHFDSVLRESAAVPETAEGRDRTTTDSGVRCVDEGDVAGHIGPGDSATMAPASSAANVKVGTPAGIEKLRLEATIEPGM